MYISSAVGGRTQTWWQRVGMIFFFFLELMSTICIIQDIQPSDPFGFLFANGYHIAMNHDLRALSRYFADHAFSIPRFLGADLPQDRKPRRVRGLVLRILSLDETRKESPSLCLLCRYCHP